MEHGKPASHHYASKCSIIVLLTKQKGQTIMQHALINHDIETVERQIKNFIADEGFKIFDDIDQRQEAVNVGLEIPETRLIIFGNPKVGTLLMQENDDITFELPIKILLIQKEKQTELIYRDPLNFPGNNELSAQGQAILQRMHTMYTKMIAAAKQ